MHADSRAVSTDCCPRSRARVSVSFVACHIARASLSRVGTETSTTASHPPTNATIATPARHPLVADDADAVTSETQE